MTGHRVTQIQRHRVTELNIRYKVTLCEEAPLHEHLGVELRLPPAPLGHADGHPAAMPTESGGGHPLHRAQHPLDRQADHEALACELDMRRAISQM